MGTFSLSSPDKLHEGDPLSAAPRRTQPGLCPCSPRHKALANWKRRTEHRQFIDDIMSKENISKK
jgi:hypothetical protein